MNKVIVRRKKVAKSQTKRGASSPVSRTGTIRFKGETLNLRALSWKEDKDILAMFGLDALQNKIMFYESRIVDKREKAAKETLEKALEAVYIEFIKVSDEAGYYKCMKTIDKPLEWFDTLTLEEFNTLKVKVANWLMYVEIDELYMEGYREAILFFGSRKPDETYTGKEVADELRKLEGELLALKKKPQTCDSALRCVRLQDAMAAISTPAPPGVGT